MGKNQNYEIFKDMSILCVEDEEGVRISLAEYLQRRFNTVYTAENGKVGYDIYAENQPDIIMTDIQMPVMNGLDMARQIRETDIDTPIIIVSAFNDIAYLQEAIEIGIHSYVSKPVDSRKMTATLYRSAQRVKYHEMVDSLKESEELFRAVTENSPTGICLYKENFIYVNTALKNFTGYSEEELLGMSANKFLFNQSESSEEVITDSTNYKPVETREIEITTKNGALKHLEIITCTIEYKSELVHIANISDISERKWFEEELKKKQVILEGLNKELQDNIQLVEQKNVQLAHQLYTDKLTNLPNRFRLLEDISKSDSPALVILNLDSFKEINDFYGDKIGDFVLDEIAQRLKNYEDQYPVLLYKLQADEYALFSDGKIKTDDLKKLVETIHDTMENQLIFLNDQEIHIGITAGISLGSPEKLFAQADMALKSAKQSRKPFLIYDDSMKLMKEYEQNIKWLQILRNALENDRIIPYFQPIINNSNGKIEKYECLARLVDEEGHVHSPFHFIEISKRSRLYPKITRAILRRSFEVFRDAPYDFSINLSIEDIQNDETIAFIFTLLDENKEVAKRLVFEILESEGIDNYELVSEFIKRVKEYGCQIAIDDFGSGYSNFAHTLQMEVDHIKIDASLVKNIHEDKNSKIICQTIVDFSKRLSIKTIAEFVHSEEVLNMVRQIGVDSSQGFYLGEPGSGIEA